MSAPLYERLIEYARQDRVPFSMPAHKGRTDFTELIKCDATELVKTADLHCDEGAAKEANALLSRLYKSEQSFILSGGSTTAVHAMLLSVLKPGETLLTTIDCHISVINLCAVMGIKLRFADTDYNEDFMISRSVSSVLKYLNKYPDIRAVLITSPTYYGVCSDIRRIAAECRAHGKPLLVDEAHGAHFIASEKLPESSSLYADIVCHSAHKTLNALTGAAYLHVKSDLVTAERVRRCINMLETSSPSYIIAASADLAREEIESGGWEDTIALCDGFKAKIKKLGIKPLENDDKTRVVLNLSHFNISGFEVLRILSERYGIDVEMADAVNLVLIVTPKNTEKDFERLYTALYEILRTVSPRGEPEFIAPRITRGIINPRSAFFADGKTVPLHKSAGMVSRATVTAYPPGTPVIIAGETITEEHIKAVDALVKNGAKITGMNENLIDTVME